MSNGDMTNHPCRGCKYATLDEERHQCGREGLILARIDFRTCADFPFREETAPPASDTHAFDPVNHPKHYKSHPSGVECINITRHMGFNLGNALKYIWRCDLKKDAIEDLRKAIWYLNDEIAMREKEKQK